MFDKEKIKALYPEAENLMWEPMKIWQLPKGKEDKLEDVCNNGEYFASIKKDGALYQYVKTENHSYLFGRTISKQTGLLTEKVQNVPHINEALQVLWPNSVLVVEIYYPSGSSKDTTTIMGCLPELAIKRQKENPIHAYAHDILMYNNIDLRQVPAIVRYKILEAIWRKHNFDAFDFLELAQPIYENIYKAANEVIANGEEGLVLRKKDSIWDCGKRPAWQTIKIKQFVEVDLVCIGTEPATKLYTGKEIETWPYWENKDGEKESGLFYNFEDYTPITKPYFYGWPGAIDIGAYNDNGKLIKLGTVSSGLTDKDKENLFKNPEEYIGAVVTLGGMSLDNQEKTVRHPKFKSWRFDKNAKECLISEVFV